MTIILNFNKEDTRLLKTYAKCHGISVSTLLEQAIFEKIENEHDLCEYEKAMAEYNKDQTTYTLNEVECELG